VVTVSADHVVAGVLLVVAWVSFAMMTVSARRAGRALAHVEWTLENVNAESRQVERTLAEALGFPKYGDELPPGTALPYPAGEPDTYVLGDHTPVSLAREAARRIHALETREGTQ
jgi:hypothetical protein